MAARCGKATETATEYEAQAIKLVCVGLARHGDPLIEHINCRQFIGYRSNYAVFPGDSFALITPRHKLMENSKRNTVFYCSQTANYFLWPAGAR